MAAMAPVPTGTASCMYCPRRRTIRTASAKASAPATTRAEYSPRLWPAARAGTRPCSAHAAAAATLAVRTAGCVFAVRPRSASGPSKMTRVRSVSRVAFASSKMALARGEVSEKARPMPAAWHPRPGKRNAIIAESRGRSPSVEGRAPGDAAPEGREEDEITRFESPGRRRLLQGHVDRGRPRVAVAIEIDEDPLHGQGQPLGGRLDDP